MKISKSLRNTFLKLMAVVMVFTSIAAFPATEANAAANKALKITASFDGNTLTQEGRSKNTYYVGAVYTKQQVKLTKNMKMQATVYIPQSLLSGVRNQFRFGPEIALYDNTLKYVGTVWDKLGKYITVYNNGYGIKVLTNPGYKASVTKSGKYYKVTMTVPMDKKYYNTKNKKVNIKTNQTYTICMSMEIFAAEVAGKGSIYVDDLKLNTKPAVSLNFSKKTYSPLASCAGKKVKVSTATIK